MRIASLVVAFAAALAVTAGAATAAMAQSQPAAPAAASPPPAGGSLAVGEATSGAYVLGRDDVIEVSLLGRSDWGGRARVQADGTVQLTLVGKVQAAEKTTAELAEAIRKALQTGGYYADPIVNVEVASYASRYVIVLGGVGQPGLVPINRPYRISEILARVGGIREGSADYLVVRSLDGKEKHYKVKDLAMGDAGQDPFVAPGDKIYSPPADMFYISGAVKGPGGFPLVSDMTVGMAIARAGGLTEQGSDGKVEITRAGKKIKVDSAAKVQAGDVLSVGTKLF